MRRARHVTVRWTRVVVLLLGSAKAWADYSPSAKCAPPPECTTCRPGDCEAAALDAGLVRSDCADFTGLSSSSSAIYYYCPPGVTVSRVHTCGCSSAEAAVAALLAVAPLLRRRSQRRKGRAARGGETRSREAPSAYRTS